MSAPTLNELTRHAATIPSLPEVINYLMRTLSDERADVDTLAQHINSDPAIVGRLLAAANSAASGLSSPVFSAKQAFLVLGADRVVKIILASALAYRYDIRGNGFDARMLWRHSIGVATCAQTLAEHHGQISTEIAFTSGLLHDIGQMLMYVGSPTEYLQVLKTHQDEDLPLIECERTVFGFDHANAGEALARTWKLPEDICEAIGAHHEPDGIGSDIGNLVHASEVLSHALDLGEQSNNRVPELSDLACAELGLSWSKIAGHFGEIEARYQGFRSALGI